MVPSSLAIRTLQPDTAVLSASPLPAAYGAGTGGAQELLVCTESRVLLLRWDGERVLLRQELRSAAALLHTVSLASGHVLAAFADATLRCYSRTPGGELQQCAQAKLSAGPSSTPCSAPPQPRPVFSNPVGLGQQCSLLVASLCEGLLHLITVRAGGGGAVTLEVAECRLKDVVSADAGEAGWGLGLGWGWAMRCGVRGVQRSGAASAGLGLFGCGGLAGLG